MRQKDPRLFYLTMEVTVRKAGVKTVLALDDEARPAILQACHPKGDSRFCLQTKPGGLIRVHTSTLEPTSLYKSLFISEETSSDELLTLLLTCFNSHDPVEQYSLYEVSIYAFSTFFITSCDNFYVLRKVSFNVRFIGCWHSTKFLCCFLFDCFLKVCSAQEYQRKLHPDDLPLRAQQQRIQRGEQCHFIVRKNPHYARRILAAVSETKATPLIAAPLTESNLAALDEQMADLRLNKSTGCSHSSPKSTEPNANNRRYVSVYLGDRTAMCKKCRNNFRSCEFCSKSCSRRLSGSRLARIPTNSNLTENVIAENEVISRLTYNPVYNIREIRTVCNSFSSLAGDKIELDTSLPQSALKRPSINNVTNGTTSTSVVREVVNNNPAKGYGNFVYI